MLDERLGRWAGRLQWAEGTAGALHDAARTVVDVPALGVPTGEVTAAVLGALDGRLAQTSTGPPGRALTAHR